jgi:hypothetical protein
MRKNRSCLSEARFYKDIGVCWDTHDLSEAQSKTRRVKLGLQIESEAICYAVEKSLSEKVQSIAKKQGVSSDTLVNLWIQEKVQEQISR